LKAPLHLARRDRIALGFRLAGALLGFGVIIYGFATSSWNSPMVLGLFGFVAIGGALSYYLLTSIVRCPTCAEKVTNFRIGPVDARRKLFSCAHCGTNSWLREGFYWQSEFSA